MVRLCVDCNVDISHRVRVRPGTNLLAGNAYLCEGCATTRQREHKRRAKLAWRLAHKDYHLAKSREWKRRHAICRLAVLPCAGCGALWTRHGKDRGKFGARCGCRLFYDRMGNADRRRRWYARMKQEKAA